jgi:drug/metabolite transporter (DMT)-like permease
VTFTHEGADAGVSTFIVTMSIIPGAFIDWIFFSHPLRKRQWIGVGIFLLAGYCMLNFPSLEALRHLPPWVWLSGCIAFLVAVNEGITQAMSRHQRKEDKLDPFVNNLWVGLSTVVVCSIGLLFTYSSIDGSTLLRVFWVSATLLGLVTVLSIMFKLWSYQMGGSIALKKVAMQGTYLVLATCAGIIWLSEVVTVGKIIGIPAFFIAYTVVDEKAWQFLISRFHHLPREPKPKEPVL